VTQKTKDQEFILGVDLDGVVADYEKAFARISGEILNLGPEHFPQADNWSFVQSNWPFETEEQFRSIHSQAVEKYNMFRNLPVIQGASEALWRLSDGGVRIRIVTHRLVVNNIHAVAVGDTVTWLDENNIPYRDICFVRDKADVGADMYVDDGPSNILSLQEAVGKNNVLIYNQLYNQHLAGLRVKNWEDLISEVSNRTGQTY